MKIWLKLHSSQNYVCQEQRIDLIFGLRTSLILKIINSRCVLADLALIWFPPVPVCFRRYRSGGGRNVSASPIVRWEFFPEVYSSATWEWYFDWNLLNYKVNNALQNSKICMFENTLFVLEEEVLEALELYFQYFHCENVHYGKPYSIP